MTDALIVFCTCSSREEALKLADSIVGEGAAACVNIVPGIESVYRLRTRIGLSRQTAVVGAVGATFVLGEGIHPGRLAQ